MKKCVPLPEEIGKRIKDMRLSKGMRQQELADALHKTRQAVSLWECGERIPSIDDLCSIADFFETSCDYLLRGYETENAGIVRKTGLSNEAVNCLRSLHESNPSYAEFVDYLLNESAFEVSVKGAIEACCHNKSSVNLMLDSPEEANRESLFSEACQYRSVKMFDFIVSQYVKRGKQ